MEPRIVQRATMPPAKCVISGDIDGPFIDTGVRCDQVAPYIYLHVPVVEWLARELCEMVPKAEVDAIREAFEGQTERIAELEKFVEAHQAFSTAVEGLEAEPVAA